MAKKSKGSGDALDNSDGTSTSENDLVVFKDAVKDAYEDSVISKEEAQVLNELAGKLNIGMEERRRISREVKEESGHKIITISDGLFDGNEELIPTWINDAPSENDMQDIDAPFKDETFEFDDDVEDDSLEHVTSTTGSEGDGSTGGSEREVFCYYCGASNQVSFIGDSVEFECSHCSRKQFTTRGAMEIRAHAASCKCPACQRTFVYMDDMKVVYCPWCDEENKL